MRPPFRAPAMGVCGVLLATLALAAPVQATPSTATPAAATAPCAPPTTERTVAQRAALSSSYVASWNDISAVTDGTSVFSGGSQDQLWGTWSPDRPAQQWLQYEWSGPAVLTGAALSFWTDNASETAGNGIAVPREWLLQAWVDDAWQDLALRDGAAYPRSGSTANVVEFAEPVTTTRLRALFDAATDGVSYAAVGVSELAVEGEAPEGAEGALETLASDHFNVQVSRATGGVYHLSNAQDAPSCTNYVMNPTLRKSFDVNDSRWVGDLGMRVDGSPRVTGLSDDIRTVSRDGDAVTVRYPGATAPAASPYGIKGFDLTQTYALGGTDGDILDWSITVDNPSSEQIEIEDLTVPMLMNSWWNGGDQTGIYEQNVARHSFVAKDGSYVYWQRPNGEGPYLVMVPKAGTSLEFRNKARTGEGLFGEQDPAWEGLVEFAIHSGNLQTERAGMIGGYLPATSATLDAGQSASYGFTFRWADDYGDLRDALFEAGVVDVVSLPGMVIPQDQAATLAVRARDGIDAVVGEDGKDVTVTAAGTRNGYRLYRITFGDLGPHDVTVRYGGGRESVLQYNSIAPVEELVASHADFLVDHQQARGTGRGYEGAFLQWDMSRQDQVTWHNYPGGGWKQWMAGGSDDLGLSPAVFLSEQNLDAPDQEQVAALDYYLEEFIWGYMQTQTDEAGERTYRVYHWYDGVDGSAPGTDDGLATWRVMNYPHVWNTYLNMYRIATAYPQIDTELTADTYLMRAYNTMRAYFEHPNVGVLDDASRHMGSMGEMTMPEVVQALQDEGHAAEAAQLETFIRAKGVEMLSREYPFASEMSIDTTAFEAVYTLAKRYGDDAMARKVTMASLSARGQQPLWYYYGSDNRHMGESWWNLGYETQLGAWQQQDYLQSYDAAADGIDPDEAMRSTYGAYLGGWSNINAGQISSEPANIGAASWQYQSQLGAGEGGWGYMPMLDGWWAWSGEADLGFWGGLRTASVNVVDDDVVGLYAYGGEVDLRDGRYTVTPKDGVRTRLNLYTENKLGISLERSRYTSATIAEGARDLRLTLENVSGSSTYSPQIALRNLPSGTYQVSVDGVRTTTVVSDGSSATLSLPGLTGSGQVVRIWQDTTAPTLTAGTGQRTGPDSGTVGFTSDEDGDYYLVAVDAGAPVPTIETSGSGTAVLAGQPVTHTLTALGPAAKDVYVVVRDAAGNESRSVMVPVGAYVPEAQVPGAPQGATAVSGESSARVTWRAPASDGGAAVTGYTVTATPGGAVCTTTGGTSCVVPGLANGTSYTFAVAATNSAGTSPASTSTAPVTPSFAPGTTAGVSLSVTARASCAAGTPRLTVTVVNKEKVKVDLRVVTAYGTARVSGLKPGFAVTRTMTGPVGGSVAAGNVTISATKVVKGKAVRTTYQAGHLAASCSS